MLKKFTQPRPGLPGKSFDGSYGVDTKDIIAVPTIDFGFCTCSSEVLSMYTTDLLISQLFLDEVEYFSAVSDNFAVNTIGDGGKWVGSLQYGHAVSIPNPIFSQVYNCPCIF